MVNQLQVDNTIRFLVTMHPESIRSSGETLTVLFDGAFDSDTALEEGLTIDESVDFGTVLLEMQDKDGSLNVPFFTSFSGVEIPSN